MTLTLISICIAGGIFYMLTGFFLYIFIVSGMIVDQKAKDHLVGITPPRSSIFETSGDKLVCFHCLFFWWAIIWCLGIKLVYEIRRDLL